MLLAHVIVIATANGILMQRERLTEEGAFQLFVGLHNVPTRRLGNVAAWLVENPQSRCTADQVTAAQHRSAVRGVPSLQHRQGQ